MDLDNITLQQLVNAMYPILAGAGGTGIIFYTIMKFFGKRTFKSLVVDIITDEYEDNLKSKIHHTIEEKQEEDFEEIKKYINKEIETHLENHSMKCERKSVEMNDNRYLLRKEFKVYMESQKEQNDRVEKAISEVRDVCSKILFKLNEN